MKKIAFILLFIPVVLSGQIGLKNLAILKPRPNVIQANPSADNWTEAIETVASSSSIPVTNNSPNSLLIAAVFTQDEVMDATQFDYAGEALTELTNIANVDKWFVYYKIGPAGGSNLLEFAHNRGTVRHSLVAIVIGNADQSSPFTDHNTQTNTSASISATVSSSAKELVLDLAVIDSSATITVDASQVELFQNNPGNFPHFSSTSKVSSASTTMDWSLSGSRNWFQTAVSIKGPQ